MAFAFKEAQEHLADFVAADELLSGIVARHVRLNLSVDRIRRLSQTQQALATKHLFSWKPNLL
jgi:hypothetical protein